TAFLDYNWESHGPAAQRRGLLFSTQANTVVEQSTTPHVPLWQGDGAAVMKTRHFLSLDDLGADGIRHVVDQAIALKTATPGERGWPLAGRTLGMLFEKASTRTRVSFETGMTRLG